MVDIRKFVNNHRPERKSALLLLPSNAALFLKGLYTGLARGLACQRRRLPAAGRVAMCLLLGGMVLISTSCMSNGTSDGQALEVHLDNPSVCDGLVWLGTFSSAPSGPLNDDAYYNSTEGESFVYLDSDWYELCQDGANGTNGTNGGTNGVGVPTGGTANQVLSKIDGTDYNTQWSSALSVTSVTATTYCNIIGSSNSSFGANSLQNNTTGSQNSAFGQAALLNNTNGIYNSAFGQNSLPNNTTGYANNAFGVGALYNNTSGSYNSAFGVDALPNNTTGSYNSAFGSVALLLNTTGNNNLGLGYYAGLYNTTISNQLFINTFDQGSYANDVSNSLIYGIFNASPSSQTLAINAGNVQLSYLPSYANNAAALSGGLVAGDLYRLSGGSAVDPEPIYIVH